MGLFETLVLCMVVVTIDTLVYKDPSMAAVEKIAAGLEYFLLALPLPMFTVYLLHSCGENRTNSALFRVVLAIWIFFLILLGITQFTTIFYYVTPDNRFVRGEWHVLLMAPMVIIPLLNLIGVLRRKKILPPRYFVAFLIHLLPLIATFLLHIFFNSDMIIFFGVVISTLSMFAIILYDQIEQYLRLQQEISQQRVRITVLQMRPHFICNALMSIYYICAQSPEKAQRVTLDFTTYLRKNFNAIACEGTIPFSDELEHTSAYLAIEQVQFEDDLSVEFDTPHKNFRVPPLTLQPIVENAIKHCMKPEYVPLHITIRTRKTESGSELIVEDNGPGFAQDDSRPHTALENIRERLQMCGGKLAILQREEGGTAVKVIIP